MRCKYKGTGVWEGRCTGTKEVDPCVGQDQCPRFKPACTTNGDRIRAMSDEELGKYLGVAFHCYGCPARKFCDSVDHLYECHETLVAWLQQPYKED